MAPLVLDRRELSNCEEIVSKSLKNKDFYAVELDPADSGE